MVNGSRDINPGDELTGSRKAAILLLAIDQEAASLVLKQLESRAIEEITREMAVIGQIPPTVRDSVLDEFYGLALATNWAREGGLDYARSLLCDTLDPAEANRIIRQISTQFRKSPFSFLQQAETQNLLAFIQDEHPQTIALIVSHLGFNKSAEILGGLPGPKQIEVVKRVANMEQTNPDVVTEVERGLEARLSSVLSQSFEKIGGIETVVEMLNLVDRTTEKSILEGIEAEDPDLVEQIRRLMFVFEDVLHVNDKDIQAVLKEIDNEELAMALKTASDELKDLIFRNMSDRASQLIQEEMEFMGPVRVSDVESSQQRIADVVRRLEDAGEIVISGRGAESEMIV